MASSKKKGPVEKIALQCTECKQKNYTTEKNRRNTPELQRLEHWSPKPGVVGSNPTWPAGTLGSCKEQSMKKIGRYFRECWLEMKKVSWPTRQVVIHSTWIVILSTIAFAVVLGLVDTLLGLGLDLIF